MNRQPSSQIGTYWSCLRIWGSYDLIESEELYATHRKTKSIQSYLRIWERYDPIELGLGEPKKGGYVGIA